MPVTPDASSAARAPAGATRSYLAFDFGTARVGVASGNSLMQRGEPRGTVAAKGDARFEAIGKLIAERAIEKGVKDVVFDRGEYIYHGRVKALAEAAREAGLNF